MYFQPITVQVTQRTNISIDGGDSSFQFSLDRSIRSIRWINGGDKGRPATHIIIQQLDETYFRGRGAVAAGSRKRHRPAGGRRRSSSQLYHQQQHHMLYIVTLDSANK